MLSAVELRAAFAARELSPVEMIDAAAEHAELGAFITLTLDAAREQARAAERAYARGEARPLEGLTLAVKDLYDTAGVRTTYGSRIFADHVPDADAALVRRAKEAGAIVVGKTLTHEFAWGITSVNPHFPPCRNPYDPERVPGGSSGGSAVALATGAAALALGTDTGGSIRIPAAFCGVSGLKPTYGAAQHRRASIRSRPRSTTPARWRARRPTCRLFYEALAGARRRRAGAPDRGLPGPARAPARAGHPARVRRRRRRARRDRGRLRRPGAAVPDLRDDPERRGRASRTPSSSPRAATSTATTSRPARRGGGGHARRVRRGDDRARAHPRRVRTRCSRTADLLLTPISAVPPEPIEQPTHQAFRDGVLPYTVPQDLAGLPTCAVPVGFDDLGLPVGVQLTGPPRSEGRVLAAAERLYAATASARAGSASAP